ncbi:MAG: polysaccharide deacetylase family protein [Spirochaetia bacterium]|nr:polysaccharide deacetylase family protein [Spirochaetia bacterium]
MNLTSMKLHRINKFIGSTSALGIAVALYFGAPNIAAYYQSQKPDAKTSISVNEYNRVPIFLFHNLDGEGRYAISRHEFRRYLELIKEEQVDVISLSELYEASKTNKRFQRPSCVITIDDDFKNIVRIAAPLLREFSYPASIFVYINNISNDPRAGTSWEDLDRLRKEGFEIQNHSYSHTMFHVPRSNESPENYYSRVTKEIITSREILEERLPGLKIYAFAYPMGYHSPSLKERLFHADYSLLLTTDASTVNLDSPFTGTFDRFTIQHLENGDYKNTFRRLLIKAKIPAENEAYPVKQLASDEQSSDS